MYVKTILMLSIATTLMGCANFGSSSKSMTPDEMWAEGKRQTEKGEKMVNSAQDRSAEGRKAVRDGEAMIQEGTKQVEQSRADYQKTTKQLGNSSKPDQVAFESDQLKRIAKRWEDGVDKIRDGNKMIQKGNKIIKSSQEDIFKGRSMIEKGSQMMIDSQVSSY